jgi:hypothetical protein
MRLTALALLATLPALAAAQTIETPVPFDSARRVVAVTPSVAERLKLASPAWPVTGEYSEVRLYSISPGDAFVLVVHRPNGSFERHVLTPTDRSRLGTAIDVAMVTSGRPAAELAADLVSEPAGNAFARHLTFLSAVAYGPLAASLVDDESGAGALYLLTTGLTYFVSYSAARSNRFTRAQSTLAGDLGLSAGVGGWLLGYAATGESEREVRFLSLLSAGIGTVAGASLGAKLSDAEAHAVTLGIQTGAVAAMTLGNFAGIDGRATALAVTLAGAAGYPLGVRYPRRASYNVTAGDVEATSTAGLVGAAWAAASLGDDPSDHRVAATLGAGFLAGELIGERVLARGFDLSESQANTLKIGALAGGLVGLAIPVLADADGVSPIMLSVAAGATLGMSALAGTFNSRVAGPARATRFQTYRGPRFSFSPLGLSGVLAGARGRHVIGRLSF